MYEYDDIKTTLLMLSDNVNALDILLQFEDVIEKSGVYVYKNWDLGEVVDGPHIEKHWVEITLMYPRKKMPEPEGALRLTKAGAKVYYKKDVYKEPKRVLGPEDIEDPVIKKAKLIKHDVWLIKIRMPRRLIDQEIEEYLDLKDIDYDVDTDDIEDAYNNNVDGITDTTDTNQEVMSDLDEF